MPTTPPRETAEPDNVKPILEWLALAHGQNGPEEASGLRQQLLLLRDTPVPGWQRLKLLDLLYAHAGKVILAQLPKLRDITLPISRRTRQKVRITQELLATMAQDYLNTLAELFDPEANGKASSPFGAVQRTMQCLAWHLLISHLVAAPAGTGIWQQFHATYRTFRRLGDSLEALPDSGQRIEQTYLSSLLLAIAQPASFTSRELEFISQYIAASNARMQLVDAAPAGEDGVFWIDPERDAPAHALARRAPPPEKSLYYFACDAIAQRASDHMAALEGGLPAAQLGLPEFADAAAGHGVLRRLIGLWGHPAKRRFPRRRQSYRAELCAGLEQLWHLLQGSEEKPATSEWMVINESPDGYAMMHVAGETDALGAGDIVALHPRHDEADGGAEWQICIVRWALSDNPEHIEVGLQVLAPRAIPAVLALPHAPHNGGKTSALLLPQLPPLRHQQALVVPTGRIDDLAQKMVVLVDQDNVAVLELRATQLDEQTSSVEVFNVEPDERP